VPLPGYPSPPGAKNESLHNVVGPASYTQVSTGSPPTGGQTVSATAFGLQYITAAWIVNGSENGQYYGNVFLNPTQLSGGSASITLQWITAATGAEAAGAANLSSFHLRIMAVGY